MSYRTFALTGRNLLLDTQGATLGYVQIALAGRFNT